ncbi:hypothetical protein EJ06DRAFT_527169 [Trichodelitschia bisporula]|uniref:Uncharacterized protein n=1 Tax=Trichodelitschia bisporula TaxID=703511 RepID=A0A6G1I5G2_9PEZI|nr:hypothetical protein EJ06DRAFT_527169 [Trichodelitschia bisporula]
MVGQKDKHPLQRRLRNTPVCILCARPKEAEKIASTLKAGEKVAGHQISPTYKGLTFWFGAFTLADGSELAYYVTYSRRQGVQSFIVDASIILHTLRPRYVVHSGVCAGDVIFGEAGINYEEGKWEVHGEEMVFLPDWDTVRVSAGDMQSFAEYRPRTHYGDYLTGSAVRGDAERVFKQAKSVGHPRGVSGLSNFRSLAERQLRSIWKPAHSSSSNRSHHLEAELW